jgi:hydroxyethylthiazole kinase-like uncharacterized protein yjeF
MQKLFDEVVTLDKRCYEEFSLSEDILMEHSAQGMEKFIREKFPKGSKVLIVCGSGNNGADGIALSRLLAYAYDVELFYVKDSHSPMAILQHKRAHAVGVKTTFELNNCDVVVDAVLGTGFDGKFSSEVDAVMRTINKLDAYKIACDIPSGLKMDGQCDKHTFVADTTLTMGALKKSMYSDRAKNYLGTIKVLNLGIAREIYEGDTNWNLLDESDMKLPHRTIQDTHKGSYGHLALTCGEKAGASTMSALSALRFGSGIVSLVGYENEHNLHMPYTIMYSHQVPSNTTALACGMGLGMEFNDKELQNFLDNTLPLVADADIFHMPILLEILKRKNVVITPHPKEFIALLKQTKIADVTTQELQNERFKYTEEFCAKYPNVTLLLKGANVIIGKKDKFFINPHGSPVLAKGGSGDVLSGLIGALLAQGQDPLEATLNASLAHTKLASNYQGADFSLTANDLIEGIGNL